MWNVMRWFGDTWLGGYEHWEGQLKRVTKSSADAYLDIIRLWDPAPVGRIKDTGAVDSAA